MGQGSGPVGADETTLRRAVDLDSMVSSVGAGAVLVGVLCLGAAASMWSRVLRSRGEDVQATVTDASVIESNAGNASVIESNAGNASVIESNAGSAEYALDVAFEYRYDGRRYENRRLVHPQSVSGADGGEPTVPSTYREGAPVTVTVPPDRPEDGSIPDPGRQATYRIAVPAIALVGLLAVAIGTWLVL